MQHKSIWSKPTKEEETKTTEKRIYSERVQSLIDEYQISSTLADKIEANLKLSLDERYEKFIKPYQTSETYHQFAMMNPIAKKLFVRQLLCDDGIIALTEELLTVNDALQISYDVMSKLLFSNFEIVRSGTMTIEEIIKDGENDSFLFLWLITEKPLRKLYSEKLISYMLANILYSNHFDTFTLLNSNESVDALRKKWVQLDKIDLYNLDELEEQFEKYQDVARRDGNRLLTFSDTIKKLVKENKISLSIAEEIQVNLNLPCQVRYEFIKDSYEKKLEKIYTGLSHYDVYEIDFNSDTELLETINNYNSLTANVYLILATDNGMIALTEGLFTPEEALELSRRSLVYFLKQGGLDYLRDKTITLDEFNQNPELAIDLLGDEYGRVALKRRLVTIKQAERLDSKVYEKLLKTIEGIEALENGQIDINKAAEMSQAEIFAELARLSDKKPSF